LQPAYSPSAPQRLNINFVDDHIAGRSLWAVDTADTLPRSLRDAAPFSNQRERAWPMSFQPSFVAPAGAPRFTEPATEITSTSQGAGRRVTLKVHASPSANRVIVLIPNEAGLVGIEIAGKTLVPAKDGARPFGTVLACTTNDCREMSVTLDFDSRRAANIIVAEQRFGLPSDGAKLVKAESDLAVPVRTGDSTIVFGQLKLP
jgi:hypothetical protein